MKKVVLAYSGGLDTSYCVKYLSEEKGLEVYAITVNTADSPLTSSKPLKQKPNF
jgi:argininosuccinate synthase